MSRSMRLELCAWLVLAPSLLWFVQLTSGYPVTWPRLLLSTVMGLAGGWMACASRFPLRWWLFAHLSMTMLLVRWHVLFGGEPLYKHPLADSACCLWIASGVVGGLLYSSWLTWRHPWETHEGQALVYVWVGVYLGLPLLAWALVRTAQRLAAGHDARLAWAWQRLGDLDAERLTLAVYILRHSPRAGGDVQYQQVEHLT